MTKLVRLEVIQKAASGTPSVKVNRSAFVYLDPRKSDKQNFAQCRTCKMWLGAEKRICSLHGKDVEVKGDMTCGLYSYGHAKPSEAEHVSAAVTPKESGLEERDVRCENCAHYLPEESTCGLYGELNRSQPKLFDLDVNVSKYGCCNANVPHAKSQDVRKSNPPLVSVKE